MLRQLILAEILVRSAGTPLYRGELARRIGVSPSSLQRPLRALEATGILKTTRRGRELLYEADPTNPLIPELAGLLRKTRGLLDVLREALDPVRQRVRFAFVYGSMASGTERPGSDVDLFVVGEATLGELSPLLVEPERVLGREVNAVSYSSDDFHSKARSKAHFVHSVLDKPRLFVVGNEDELGAVVEGGSRRAPSHEQRGTRRSTRRRTPQPR